MTVQRCGWLPLLQLIVFLHCRFLVHSADQRDVEEDGTAHEEALQYVHAAIDANGDKKASKEEILKFIENDEADQAADHDIKRMDTTRQGHVSLNDYLNDVLSPTSSQLSADTADAERALEILRRDETAYFNSADTNGDGVLDKHEMKELRGRTQGTMLDLKVKHSIGDADTDNNGVLSLEEFIASNLEYPTGPKGSSRENDDTQSKKQLFSRLDANDDGHVDHGELWMLQSGRIHQEDVADRFVKSMDKNGDQLIDGNEFAQSKNNVSDMELQSLLMAWAKKRPVIGQR